MPSNTNINPNTFKKTTIMQNNSSTNRYQNKPDKSNRDVVIDNDHLINQAEYFLSKFLQPKCMEDERKYRDLTPMCNVSAINQCSRLIVARSIRAIQPLSNHDGAISKNEIMHQYIKNKWVKYLELSDDNPLLISKDSYNFDHRASIYCCIDAVVRFNVEKVAINIHYASSATLKKVQEKGPLKNHVIAMVASLHLSGCLHHGLLIYDHGNNNGDVKIFHVRRSDTIYDAVVKKGKKIKKYINNNELPDKCPGFQNKSCKHLC